jgi:hypothetical protein
MPPVIVDLIDHAETVTVAQLGVKINVVSKNPGEILRHAVWQAGGVHCAKSEDWTTPPCMWTRLSSCTVFDDTRSSPSWGSMM